MRKKYELKLMRKNRRKEEREDGVVSKKEKKMQKHTLYKMHML